jgi:hypothetical protein
MASNLAPVYLDDARVTLQGDPRPQVSKILEAGGRALGPSFQVVRLREAAGADGHPIGLDDVIDREKAITPVYLRVLPVPGATGSVAVGRKDGATSAPGDITRGTEAVSPSQRSSGEAAARSGASRRFAESQSFADPAHKGGSPRQAQGARPSSKEGGIRTQETASEEGAAATSDPHRTVTTTARRGALEKASEEE